jgi:N-acetylglutamate synthase-like GNAT family acetyltransferase
MEERKDEELQKIKEIISKLNEADAKAIIKVLRKEEMYSEFKKEIVFDNIKGAFGCLACIPGDQDLWNYNDSDEDFAPDEEGK